MNVYLLHILFDFLFLSSILVTNFIFLNLRSIFKFNIIETLIIAFLSLIFSFAYQYADKTFFPVTPIVILVAILYYKNEVHALLALLPTIIFIILSKSNSISLIILYTSLSITLFLPRILTSFFSMKKILHFFILIILYLFSLFIYRIYLLFNSEILPIDLINYSFGPIVAILFLIFTLFFSKFAAETANLYKSNNFIYDYFHKVGLSKIKIQKFIFDNKITRGIYIQYRFNHPDLDFIKKEKLFSYVNNFIYEKFKKYKSIFIQPNTMDFGFFFIPQKLKINIFNIINDNNLFDRHYDDPLKEVENTFAKINEWTMKNNYDSTFLVAASFYGYQTSSIMDTINYSKFTLDDRSFITTNIVSAFDWKRYKFKKEEMEQVNIINKLINVNKVGNIFLNIYDSYENKSIGHFALPIIIDELSITYNDLLEYAHSNGVETFLDRLSAANAINIFHGYNTKKKIFIQYPVKYLSSELFSINQFKFILWKYKVNHKNTVLLLNVDGIHFNGKNMLEKNINLLKSINVEIGLYNVSSKLSKKIQDKLKPKYILLKESLYNSSNINYNLKNTINDLNYNDCILIAHNIKTWFALKKVISLGMRYFSGILFEKNNSTPKKLNSNFKKYIDETIKSI